MADRALRGSRLGSTSYESDAGVEPAAREDTVFHCPHGHTFMVPFSVEADIPNEWECRCGAIALRADAAPSEEKRVRPVRTHWDMLLERRTVGDLEDLLNERLQLLRSGKLTMIDHRKSA